MAMKTEQARRREGTKARRGGRRKRGLATVEMAIVLPILLWLTFGLIEYGWLFINHQQLTNACRHVARVAVLADTTNAEYEQAIVDAMSVAGFSEGQYTYEPGSLPVDIEPGEEFTVRITVFYDEITLGLPLIPTPARITDSFTMLKEGT